MDIRFLPHNSHLEHAERFAELDPHLRQLPKQPYVYVSPILAELPRNSGGVYTLTGGRQVGKTTLLKQWMATLLADNVDPQAIAFFSGELIDDHHVLLRLLQEQLVAMPGSYMQYLLIDEVTYIKDWDKAIKYAADAGMLENVELLLTGSDSIILREARVRFPGRRGKSDIVDFHLYPLSFAEVVAMKKIAIDKIDELYQELERYLMHGGYLTAINDLARYGSIKKATFSTYSDWIRGDILKRGKRELYLQEIFTALIKRYGSQITWHSLANDLSIDHHKTVSDYVELLTTMDVLFVQYALREDKLTAAVKKARKVIFTDPFIFHAIRAWVWPVADPFQQQVRSAINDPFLVSKLVEACVVNHYRRLYPTYYIKAEGEVDVAYIDHEQFWPVEVKWTNQIRPNDFKQAAKYNNSIILSKTSVPGILQGVVTEPLPLALLKLS
ncbi:MAG: ATP-binding protein [Gammaproteobacteria bacterium]|nr:ATP-binding protein [Gammaproteobacteria bacterium]